MIAEGNDSDTLGDGNPQYLVGARNNASITAPDLIPGGEAAFGVGPRWALAELCGGDRRQAA